MSERPLCARMIVSPHPAKLDDYYIYCSPPSKENVSHILDRETTDFCDNCPDYLNPMENK